MNMSLVASLVRRDVASRYKGSMLGLLWAVLIPIMMLAVYTFVFGTVLPARWSTASSNGHSTAEFALILFSGLLLYQFFSEVVGGASTRIVNNANYVKKIIFPLEILPVVSVGAALCQALISVTLLLLFQALAGRVPSTAFLVFLPLFSIVTLTLGLSWGLAAFGVFFRDIGQIIQPALTALMFLSPIFYPRSALPEAVQPWLLLNPLTVPVEAFRDVAIFGRVPNVAHLAAHIVAAVSIALTGYLFFQKTRRGFADVL